MNDLPWEATEADDDDTDDLDDTDDDDDATERTSSASRLAQARSLMDHRRRTGTRRPRLRLSEIKGVQHADVKTPAGNAKLSLPASVATVADARRLAEEQAETSAELDALTASHKRLEKLVRSAISKDRHEVSGDAWGSYAVTMIDQVRDVLRIQNTPTALSVDSALGTVQASVSSLSVPHNKFGTAARFLPVGTALLRGWVDSKVNARQPLAAWGSPLAGAAVGTALTFLLKNRKR